MWLLLYRNKHDSTRQHRFGNIFVSVLNDRSIQMICKVDQYKGKTLNLIRQTSGSCIYISMLYILTLLQTLKIYLLFYFFEYLIPF
jgi:hypothetical protein